MDVNTCGLYIYIKKNEEERAVGSRVVHGMDVISHHLVQGRHIQLTRSMRGGIGIVTYSCYDYYNYLLIKG